MDFYSVDCKREIFKNGKWEADNRTEMLVVLAENEKDALKKINDSLNNMETDNIMVKYVLSSEIIRRNGLFFCKLVWEWRCRCARLNITFMEVNLHGI